MCYYIYVKNLDIPEEFIMSNKVIVETSARHVHLTDEHIEVLFGAGHKLTFKKEDTLLFVDPAMGDWGRLYTGFDKDFPSHMAKLCAVADIVVPNITEASFILGEEYKTSYDEKHVHSLLKRLCDLGAKKAVISGISYESSTQGAVLYDKERDEFFSYFNEHLPVEFHGTGDTFASVFAGALTRGMSDKDALSLAVDFTVDCIKQTMAENDDHSYGTKFEECIPTLIKRLK